MILVYEFEYANSNDNLAFFLNFYAQKSNLAYSIKHEGLFVRLYISGDESEILKFSDEISELIPHFIFIKNSKVFIADELNGSAGEFKNQLSNITPMMINALNSSKITPCENGVLSDVSVFKDGNFTAVTSENFNELLEFCVLNFKNGQNLRFKDSSGEFEAIKFDELSDKFDILMPTNIKNLTKIFIFEQNAQLALVSYEKPVIELKTNAIYRQNHPNSPCFFDVLAPRDIFIYEFCKRLFGEGINFIALKTQNKLFKAVVLENDYLFLNAIRYYKDGFLEFINGSKDKNLANFYLSLSELGVQDDENLRIFLSKYEDDEIKIYGKNSQFEVLNLSIPSSFERIFEMISKEEGGDRLIANFSSNFTLPSGAIDTPNSFFSLLCIVGMIFGFDSDFKKAGERLLQNAMDFNGAKGPRLDFKMASKTGFDIVKFVRSGMSFRLAGIDDKILSFGYLESFAHFLSDFCDVLKEDFEFKNVILQGSLFECKSLSNLAVKHLKQGVNVKFSKGLSLEEVL